MLEIIQITACITLTAAALYWKFTPHSQRRTYSFLFPFIIAAGLSGILLIAPSAMELGIASYSGAIYETDAIAFRYNGPYGWFFYGLLIFPLLPTLGVIPCIGKRPTLMAAIAMLALMPSVYQPLVSGLQRLTRDHAKQTATPP